MAIGTQHRLALGKVRRFDVVCAGEVLWALTTPRDCPAMETTPMRLEPAGGALNVALALAHRNLKVGLVTALADDSSGRAVFDRTASAGVDVGGVRFVEPQQGVVLLGAAGGPRIVFPYRGDAPSLEVPASWSARVLLLSGLSPAVHHAGAFCKAARAARRAGAVVVVDINARWHVWAGHDPRTIRMVLREADVVRCRQHDFAALEATEVTLQDAVRSTAVLVVSDASGARVTGPFGAIAKRWSKVDGGTGDFFTATLCAELARTGDPGGERLEPWERVLEHPF